VAEVEVTATGTTIGSLTALGAIRQAAALRPEGGGVPATRAGTGRLLAADRHRGEGETIAHLAVEVSTDAAQVTRAMAAGAGATAEIAAEGGVE
jgi:hypothetical protein